MTGQDDPADLPWSLERLDGLANTLLDELLSRGLDPDDPIMNPIVRDVGDAIVVWILKRSSKISTMDVAEAINNAIGKPDGGDHP